MATLEEFREALEGAASGRITHVSGDHKGLTFRLVTGQGQRSIRVKREDIKMAEDADALAEKVAA